MEIERTQISAETDFKNLKVIGKAFREDGHKVALNTSLEILKESLLEIFDKHYSATDAKNEIENVVDDVESPDPYDNSKLYYTKADYSDWESGWSYNPVTDKPKALPENLTHGLKNALQSGKIKRFVK